MIKIKNHAPEKAAFVEFDGGNVFVIQEDDGKIRLVVEDSNNKTQTELVLGVANK